MFGATILIHKFEEVFKVKTIFAILIVLVELISNLCAFDDKHSNIKSVQCTKFVLILMISKLQ